MERTESAATRDAGPESRRGLDFRLYATGRAVSVVGDRIALITLVFLVIHLSNSYAPALALFYVCRVLPTLVGGLVAGVLVDHVNRQRLMIGCDLGRAALVAAVPTLTSLDLRVLYPLVLLLYGLTLFFDTAAQAALPDVVPESRMIGANAILQSIQTGADLAYAVGGALVFVLKFRAPFYIDAATFLFSALMISGMRIPRHHAAPSFRVADIANRVRQGLDFLLAQPFLKWSSLTFVVAPFAGGVVFVLSPLYAQHVLAESGGLVGPLQSGAFRFSVLEVSIGVGAVLGSVATPRLARRWPRGKVFAVGVGGQGVTVLFLAATSNLYLAAAIMATTGFFNSMFIISGMTLLQTLTPTEIRGRVVAARMMMINGALALGSAAAAALLLAVPYRSLWLVLGAIIAGSSLFVWLQPSVRGQP